MEDSKISNLIKEEVNRQVDGIELIASENYVSSDVIECLGSVLTNKYSEGYPKKRYYKGNEYIDEIELEAINRARELFGAQYVNVQPYSGSPANMAVHFALLNPGDITMGMSMDAGGHLTHGAKVSFSGKYYNSYSYGVDSEGYIDYSEALKIAQKVKPKLIWTGFSAYSRIIDWSKFREIADEVGAYLIADISHIAGLVAGEVYPSPVGIADIVTTTTHKSLRGPRGAMIMCNDEELAKSIDKAVFPGLQGGPHNNVIAGIAVALKEASTDEFKKYARQIVDNAKALSNKLIEYGYSVISGGTDNHLFLVDVVKSVGITGEEASAILERVNITVNKNGVPNDDRKPWDPSGIRIGTPAITTRGLKEGDMDTVAKFIVDAFSNSGDDIKMKELRSSIKDYMSLFPIPGIS